MCPFMFVCCAGAISAMYLFIFIATNVVWRTDGSRTEEWANKSKYPKSTISLLGLASLFARYSPAPHAHPSRSLLAVSAIKMFSILLLVAFPCTVTAHASMIMPPSRNAIDATLPAWHNSNISNPPETGTIEPYNCRCTNGTEPFCNSGQGCFWFSQGCTIGCSKCDGLGARIPKWDHCPLESIKPTVNDPQYRSMNQNATAGSVEDIFYFNPWRAPGRAPVFDACGKAGGADQEVFNAGAYNKTIYAQQGDLGSVVLKPRPTGTVWKRGSVEKARW